MNSSSSQFILAEQLARRGAPDDRIMGVINPPMTQLSLEEQQIQESLMRLDTRLLNIQVGNTVFAIFGMIWQTSRISPKT